MKDKIYSTVLGYTSSISEANDLTNELCILLGVSKLLTVGTKVEITKDIYSHGFTIGSTVEIEIVDPKDTDAGVGIGKDLTYFVVSTNPINETWISVTECNVC